MCRVTTVLCTAGNGLDLYELIKAEQKRDTAAGAAGPRTLGELFGEAAAAAARPAKRQRTAMPLAAAAECEGGEAAAAAAEGEEGDEEMEDREGQEEAAAGEKGAAAAAAKGGESGKKGELVAAWRWLPFVAVPWNLHGRLIRPAYSPFVSESSFLRVVQESYTIVLCRTAVQASSSRTSRTWSTWRTASSCS